MTTPVIRVRLPDGRVGSAEGALAPDLARAQLSLDLASAGERTDTRPRPGRPVFAIHEVKAAEADDLLVDWGHPLGGINPGKKGGRPFGYAAYVCEALRPPGGGAHQRVLTKRQREQRSWATPLEHRRTRSRRTSRQRRAGDARRRTTVERVPRSAVARALPRPVAARPRCGDQLLAAGYPIGAGPR